MKNTIKIDDLGVPLFLETPIYIYIYTPFFCCEAGSFPTCRQGQSPSNLCSTSKTIDSIVSDTNLFAPGQQLVYRLIDQDGAIEMVFEALHDHPWVKATTTLHHGFGMLTNDAKATRLRVSFRSPESQEALRLPTFAMSFVHMVDTSIQSHKNIKVVGNWTDAIMAQDTTIQVQQQTSDDSISFNAGTKSNEQTPSNPSTFTVEQFNSAVTVRFVNLESFEIHIDVGVHEMHGFLFSTTPLLCAELPVEKPPVKFVTNPRVFDLSKEDLENKYIVRATTHALFQQWYVGEGDYVNTGDDLFQVTTIEGLQDIQSKVSGRVVHLQGVLPGDYLEAGVPLMIIDTSGINWFWIAGLTIGAAITIIAVIICICKCKKSAPDDPDDPDDPDPEKPSTIQSTILEFETPSGWKQISEWKHQPLGLGFYEEVIPLKVAYVGQDASHMGVRQGDSLVALGDTWHKHAGSNRDLYVIVTQKLLFIPSFWVISKSPWARTAHCLRSFFGVWEAILKRNISDISYHLSDHLWRHLESQVTTW